MKLKDNLAWTWVQMANKLTVSTQLLWLLVSTDGDRDCKHHSQALILQPIAKTKMRQKARDLCQVTTLLDATFSARLQQDSKGTQEWKWTSEGKVSTQHLLHALCWVSMLLYHPFSCKTNTSNGKAKKADSQAKTRDLCYEPFVNGH